MRILHVITSLYTGGAERLMVDLLPLLRNGGQNQVDLLLINGVDTPFKKKLEDEGIKIFALQNTNDVYHPRIISRMRRFFGNKQYDVIHTHNTATQLYVPLSRLFLSPKGKLVTTEHSTNSRRRSLWWFKPIDKWMYSRYDAIVCIAEKCKIILEEYIGHQDTIAIINNGVDVKRFLHPIKDISQQDNFIITMVAALRVEKDHETLLKAVKLLPDKYRLRIVGGGPREVADSVKARCHELNLDDRVDFMGLCMDVPNILEQSDVVVLSSHWEGLSLSSIEGMASGRPFIASDVDGLREMVNGAGVLFPHGDEKELAEKIQWLCEHPDEYREVAERCQEKARQYDISVTADKYLELYEKLLNKSSK